MARDFDNAGEVVQAVDQRQTGCRGFEQGRAQGFGEAAAVGRHADDGDSGAPWRLGQGGVDRSKHGDAPRPSVEQGAGVVAGAVRIDHGDDVEAVRAADQAMGHFAVDVFETAVCQYEGGRPLQTLTPPMSMTKVPHHIPGHGTYR